MWSKLSLPSDVTSASSLSVFKNRLKAYLFRSCYETVLLLNDTADCMSFKSKTVS